MNKYRVIIRSLICISLSSLFWGCGNQAEPPKQPQIVRKKIIAKTDKTRPSKKSKTIKGTKPSLTLKPKSDISKTPTLKTAEKKVPSSPKPKKLAVKPKSDVSKSPQAKKVPKKVAQKEPAPQPKTPQPEAPQPIELKEEPLKLQTGISKATSKATDKTTVASVPKFSETSLKPHDSPAPYNPKGKIDPFEPLFKDQPIIVASKKRKKKRIPHTPLEKISLGQLKLVGIILAHSGNKALVQEASGKGYIIKKGTYIGLNSGQVVEIQKDNVIIEEEVEDVLGKISTRKTELRLPKPPGE